VVIFSDCKSAVTAINEFYTDNKIICDIQRLHLEVTSHGIQVEIAWIPGHVGVFGNDWADLSAKKALRKDKVDIHVKMNKSEYKSIFRSQLKADWQVDWNIRNSTNTTMIKRIIPNVQFKVPRWDVSRNWEVMFNRVRSGRCRFLKSYLRLMGQHPDGLCEICHVEDSIEHFLVTCKKFYRQRRMLKYHFENKEDKNFSYENLIGGKNPPVHQVIMFIKRCKVIV
jgi:hypothetical protein